MMVPIREMTEVMKVVKEIQTVKRGQWVRLKRTMYRDDIAQVRQLSKWRMSISSFLLLLVLCFI